jgi:hypothetical protein
VFCSESDVPLSGVGNFSMVVARVKGSREVLCILYEKKMQLAVRVMAIEHAKRHADATKDLLCELLLASANSEFCINSSAFRPI